MLLDETGLKIDAFDPVLASVLGPGTQGGHRVLAEAMTHGRRRVELRDWLYCLLKAPGTIARTWLIDRRGKKPEDFLETLEDACPSAPVPGAKLPQRLTSAVVPPPVLRMLEAAERHAGAGKVTDRLLTRGLLAAEDSDLDRVLELWLGEEGLEKLKKHVGQDDLPQGNEVFTAEGQLVASAFEPSGWSFCLRMAEDAASLGAKKVTSRHMLYTLLGKDSSPLASALAARGIDVRRDLHAVLARELTHPGRKRNDDLALRKDLVFESVQGVLRDAGAGARGRGARGMAELDIARAFAASQTKELARLFPPGKALVLDGLREHLESSEPEEEEVKSGQRFSLREIEESMKRRICGQEAAIERVVPWVKRLRFGLPRDGRPAAVFLFLGPTGVGKTQLAKELARYVYGDEDSLIFLEMGQFKTKESMSGFIGAPPGYVGYGEGKLTNGLRDKPECVVLFDEIEKADTQVFDTLLRFADEGVISDPAGPVRDGRKCIIVMTTNAGQIWLRAHPGELQNPASLPDKLFRAAMRELRKRRFRPEFLGRLDERITFLPLTPATCRKIVDGVLERELEKFQKLKGVTIEVQEDVRTFLAERTFGRSLDEGARGAPRAINQFIVTPAIDLLCGDGVDGGLVGPSKLVASKKDEETVVLESAVVDGVAPREVRGER
ncbi:MAG: ATP-dependent Clp protease ATP-binding subunit [Planctomycetes bacterium]|nr:ATP-dependent Clp protease ATP-binding subunit [Planctomycetota bacterium]